MGRWLSGNAGRTHDNRQITCNQPDDDCLNMRSHRCRTPVANSLIELAYPFRQAFASPAEATLSPHAPRSPPGGQKRGTQPRRQFTTFRSGIPIRRSAAGFGPFDAHVLQPLFAVERGVRVDDQAVVGRVLRDRARRPTADDSAGGGSSSSTSMPAPANWPLAIASGMAVASTTPPRAVLTRNEPGRILAIVCALIRCYVSAVNGQCMLTMCASASRASSVSTRRTPSDLSRPSGA